ETKIPEVFPLAPEGFETVAGGDLAELSFWRLAGEPGEKSRQCSAVAAVSCPGAVDLRRVFGRLWQQARVRSAVDPCAGRDEPVEHPGGGGCRIGLHPAAFRCKLVERRPQLLWWQDCNCVAEMSVEPWCEFAPVDKQHHRAIIPQDRKRQGQRRMRHV